MKYLYLSFLSLTFVGFTALAQKKSMVAYAITGNQPGSAAWTEVKKIDLKTGEILQPVFESQQTRFRVLSARTNQELPVRLEVNGKLQDNGKLPFSSFAAACAYDQQHNRLYYTPMYINQLRYIDLSASDTRVFYFEDETFSKAQNLNDAANHITRMVIGADGNGYALSNDANHLIRFTTGKKPEITDLGALFDAATNTSNSVHNQCTSWGGDLVAAADGSLYLISANHSVFRIDIGKLEAQFLTKVQGLPASFSTNGAAVSDDGKMIVGSANTEDGFYAVDMKKWTAEKLKTSYKYRTADLANGNLAFAHEVPTETLPLFTRIPAAKSGISIYPNPVSHGYFRVSFGQDQIGKYEVQLLDLTGRILMQKAIQVSAAGQTAEFLLERPFSNGTYMVKVVTEAAKTIRTEKLIIQ